MRHCGEVDSIQYADIAQFVETGMKIKGSGERFVDLIVLTTGYNGQAHLVAELFDLKVAKKADAARGFDRRTQ